MKVVQAYGMGTESTAILLRWLTEPATRDFDLADLVLLTAMTGDEFAETGELVETHVLPLLTEHGIRFVQVARNGPSQTEGISVLSDSRSTDRLHLRTDYRLSTELTLAGTVPQRATGRRLCSLHFKGWPLDTWLAGEFGATPFRHVMGFNAGERTRILRDASYSTEARNSEYPLLEWGWSRADCEDYIESVLGVRWVKSCCEYCPFSSDRHTARYVDDPDAAVRTMMIELRSLALNPRQTLYKNLSVIRQVRESGNADAMYRFAVACQASPWSLYEVRRVLSAAKRDHAKMGPASREVKVLATGSHARCALLLGKRAEAEGLKPFCDEHGLVRAVIRPRRSTYPATEHFLVIGPAGAEPKTRAGFETRWTVARSAESYDQRRLAAQRGA